MDTCDICELVSARYDRFPVCRDCGITVCYEHAVENTVDMGDGRETCICIDCEVNEQLQEADDSDYLALDTTRDVEFD